MHNGAEYIQRGKKGPEDGGIGVTAVMFKWYMGTVHESPPSPSPSPPPPLPLPSLPTSLLHRYQPARDTPSGRLQQYVL